MSRVPIVNQEDLQILRYENGQYYKDHMDCFGSSTTTVQTDPDSRVSMDRISTMLMYLSDVEEGGETGLPDAIPVSPPDMKARMESESKCGYTAGVAVKPTKGSAILFYDLQADGNVDSFSMHRGCPVLKGTKWSATKWIHQGPFRPQGFGKLIRKRKRINPMSPGEVTDTHLWSPDVSQIVASEGECVDNDPHCPNWAAGEECENNPIWMRRRCSLSCGTCLQSDKVGAPTPDFKKHGCADGDFLCLKGKGVHVVSGVTF